MRIRRFAAVALALGWLSACDSLTTPESHTTRVVIFVGPTTGINDTLLTTGDTVRYGAVAFLLPDSVIALIRSESWGASDTVLRRVTPPDSGRFVATRLGRDTVRVRAVVKTNFGDVTVIGQKDVRVATDRFFGEITPTTVAFRGFVLAKAPPEQRFTDSTQILFAPDPSASSLAFVPGIVIGRSPDSLVALVPAGFVSGPVGLTSITPGDRDLASRRTLTRLSGDNDLDPIDRGGSNSIALPFIDVMSVHDAADVDVYAFTPNQDLQLILDLGWNVPSDLDVVIDTFNLLGQPAPLMRGQLRDTEREGPYSVTLQAGRRYELTVQAATYVGPTTYILSFLPPAATETP